jgi:hypothetical protein
VVQPTVQSEPVCTSDCTIPCTDDCTTPRITLVGVRGGSATSTTAASLALISRTMVDQLPTEIAPRLVLGHEASGEAELTIIDAGTPRPKHQFA